ncbi:MAG: 2Fe-2S iron-sulfur cluster binding domain-containing protein [Burkholderiales bacterium]|nr:2Fe-2S iron-sulfur cluster binding domain-containing protein [Burkholderiales bacterium]
MSEDPHAAGATRRGFLQSAGALAGTPLVAGPVHAATRSASEQPPAAPVALTLRVNGRDHVLHIEPRTTLLDALRDHLGLTGSKKGCDRGQCGACTVLVDGRRINACLSLALQHDGDEIVTIEGLGEPGHLHPLQAAFIAEDAFQCGYCTPGQVCSGVALMTEARRGDCSAATPDVRRTGAIALTDAEIRERMSGNLCRCGAYVNIVDAVRVVARQEGVA